MSLQCLVLLALASLLGLSDGAPSDAKKKKENDAINSSLARSQTAEKRLAEALIGPSDEIWSNRDGRAMLSDQSLLHSSDGARPNYDGGRIPSDQDLRNPSDGAWPSHNGGKIFSDQALLNPSDEAWPNQDGGGGMIFDQQLETRAGRSGKSLWSIVRGFFCIKNGKKITSQVHSSSDDSDGKAGPSKGPSRLSSGSISDGRTGRTGSRVSSERSSNPSKTPPPRTSSSSGMAGGGYQRSSMSGSVSPYEAPEFDAGQLAGLAGALANAGIGRGTQTGPTSPERQALASLDPNRDPRVQRQETPIRLRAPRLPGRENPDHWGK